MNIKNTISTLVSVIILQYTVFSQQNIFQCGQSQMEELFYKNSSPEIRIKIDKLKEALEKETREFKYQKKTHQTNYIIPVVFHIIHDNGVENISFSQIKNSLQWINQYFSKSNPNIDEVDLRFKSIIGDAKIEFRLAKIDPNGNPTNGVDRIQSSKTANAGDDAKLNPWPREKYLNIWVVRNISDGGGGGVIAGYSLLPPSAEFLPLEDGIIVNHRYVGSIGTGVDESPRVLSHEIGHWINLLHPWGGSNTPGKESNCDDDDGVTDTPNTIGRLGGCNLDQVTCGSLDNVQNIMDYSSCGLMFTEGQVSRMLAALNSRTGRRNNLWTNSNLIATGVKGLSVADFRTDNPYVCLYDTVTFYDNSDYGVVNWNWSFNNAVPSVASNKNSYTQYVHSGLQDVTLEVSDGTKTMEVTKTNTLLVLPLIGRYLPYFENFKEYSSLPDYLWTKRTIENQKVQFQIVNQGIETLDGVDDKCVMLNSYDNTSVNVSELISSTFDLSPMSYVNFSFYYAIVKKNEVGSDKLSLYVSNSCGDNWAKVWEKTGTSLYTTDETTTTKWTPSTISDWKDISVEIPLNYYSEKTMFKFEFKSSNSSTANNLYIDKIKIEGNFSSKAVLEFPKDGEKVPKNFTMKWKSTDDIDYYEYQLDTTLTFDSPVLQSGKKAWISYHPNNDDTEFHPKNLLLEQRYYWRVRYVKNNTNFSWSNIWKFKVSEVETGISSSNNIDHNVVEIYPNPSYGDINIKFKQVINWNKCQVSLYDLYGKQIINMNVLNNNKGNLQLQNNSLLSGVYLLNILFDDKIQIQKRVVLY